MILDVTVERKKNDAENMKWVTIPNEKLARMNETTVCFKLPSTEKKTKYWRFKSDKYAERLVLLEASF